MSWLACLQQVGEVRALHALLAHPEEAGVHGEVEARGAGADDDHAAALHDKHRDRHRCFARVFEDDVDILGASDLPDGFAELAGFLHVVVELGRVHLRKLAPALEVGPVDDALGAHRQDEVGLRIIRDHADGVGAGDRAELDGVGAKAARGAPHQNVLAGTQHVRTMAEQHAVGGGEG
jgi:hypothetical protein